MNYTEVVRMLICLGVLGLILFLVNTYIPMAPFVKQVINVIAVIAICFWLLQTFHLFGGHAYLR